MLPIFCKRYNNFMSGFKKLLLFLFFAGLFVSVVIFVEPPISWQQASLFQIMSFFLPLVLAMTLLIDLLIHYLPHSFILSLGLILIMAFYSVNQLNILTGLLVLLITAFSWRVFPKMKLPRFRLTYGPKIPKLHLQKQETHKLRRLRRLK